jgi:hypothetical protein
MMSKVQYLREQAARAERLASPALDAVTVERLLAMSREYRSLAEQLENGTGPAREPSAPLPH